MVRPLAACVFAYAVTVGLSGDCLDMNFCNGHGTCETQSDSCDCARPAPRGERGGGATRPP